MVGVFDFLVLGVVSYIDLKVLHDNCKDEKHALPNRAKVFHAMLLYLHFAYFYTHTYIPYLPCAEIALTHACMVAVYLPVTIF